MEYGTKHLGRGNIELARDVFEKAYGLYSLFWGLNMGLIKSEDIEDEKERE